MKVVDMHCDTIAEIYKDHKKGGRQSILENQMMLDLKKMQAGDYGLQNFALYVNLEQAKGRPFEFCMELLDTFYQEMEAHEDIIGIVRSYEDISRNWEQGRMSALLTVEEGGTCQGKTAFLRDFYRLRIHHAKTMLKETNMKLKEISEAVGYNSVEYFVRVFSAQEGVSPSSYRKQSRTIVQ